MAIRIIKRFKRTAVYYFAKTAVLIFNFIPRKLSVYLGGWIGLTIWFFSARDRYKAFRHLTLVYGAHYQPRNKHAIARQFYINSGRNLADVVRFKRYFQKEIKPLVISEGLEHFDAAYRRGQGVIGITGHIGNFELMATWLASKGYDIAVIGRELYDSRLDKLLVENRRAVGLTNIATTDSPKRLISWLRQGRALGVLIDTDSSRVRGEFIPAFGRWSYTPAGQTILGLKTGSAFVPAACLRTADNRYKVVIKPEVIVEPSGDFETDVRNVTLQCTLALEEIIKDHKDQWIWQHNRWRTRRIPGS